MSTLPNRTVRTVHQLPTDSSTAWAVLTDFPSYPEWNSAFTSLSISSASPGAPVKFTFALDYLSKPMDFSASVISLDIEKREIVWGTRPLYFSVLADVKHTIAIEDVKPIGSDGIGSESSTNNEESILVHEENFQGLLVLIFPSGFWDSVKRGFEGFGRDLIKELERRKS